MSRARSKFNGHKLEETFTVEVMEGKKNVIGQVVVDCSQGIWPNGEWIPTEAGVDSGWMDLQAAGKKSKFEGSRGQVGITYMYAGESAHPPRLSCRSRLRHAERACASLAAANDVAQNSAQRKAGIKAGDVAMTSENYQAAEEAYESALAAYPDDNDEYAGMSTVKKKLAKCREVRMIVCSCAPARR